MFVGSTPIYEDDWNRYLWDGAVTVEGYNPYEYAPEVTFVVGPEAPQDVKDLQALSGANGGITGRINNPHLTTCLLYTSPSPRDATLSRMPSSA